MRLALCFSLVKEIDCLTLADSLPPHVLDRARAQTMHTLNLILADDRVLQRAAFLDGKHCVVVAALILTSALDATVVRLHAAVKGVRDDLRFVKGLLALRLREREGEPFAELLGVGDARVEPTRAERAR